MKKSSSVLLSTLLIAANLMGTVGASGKPSKIDFSTGKVKPTPVIGSFIVRSIKGNPEADQELRKVFKRMYDAFEQLKQKGLLIPEVGIDDYPTYKARIMNKDYIRLKFSGFGFGSLFYYDKVCKCDDTDGENAIIAFDDTPIGKVEYIIRKIICSTYNLSRDGNNYLSRVIVLALEGKKNYFDIGDDTEFYSKQFLIKNTRKSILDIVNRLEPLVEELENISKSSDKFEITPKFKVESKFIPYDRLLERNLCGGYDGNSIDQSRMWNNIETMYRALEENDLLNEKIISMREEAHEKLYAFGEEIARVTRQAQLNYERVDVWTERKWDQRKQDLLKVVFKNLYNAVKEEYIKNCETLEK